MDPMDGMNRAAEPPRITALDFEDFHDLAHSLFSRHCYGGLRGRWLHLRYLLEFKLIPLWIGRLYRVLRCPFGRHAPADVFVRRGTQLIYDGTVCEFCGAHLPGSEPGDIAAGWDEEGAGARR